MALPRRRTTFQTRTIPAATARTQFGQLLELAVTQGMRFVVSRNGRPAVAIIPIEQYLEGAGPRSAILRKLHTAAKRRGVDLLSMTKVDHVIATVRRQSRNGRGTR